MQFDGTYYHFYSLCNNAVEIKRIIIHVGDDIIWSMDKNDMRLSRDEVDSSLREVVSEDKATLVVEVDILTNLGLLRGAMNCYTLEVENVNRRGYEILGLYYNIFNN
jgi:hypothetical protein